MRALGRKATGERLARMQASRQWVGNRFGTIVRPAPPEPREPMPLLEFFCSKEGRKPLRPLPSVDPREGWKVHPSTDLRVTWLGHSTLLMELDGYRLLTDPMWGSAPRRRDGSGPAASNPFPSR